LEKTPLIVNKPDCYTDQEWQEYIELWRASVWFKNEHPEELLKNVCDDCNLPFQLSQMIRGTCKPVDPLNTPYARVERGEPETVGEDEVWTDV